MSKPETKFKLSVVLTDNRKSTHHFHTVKSARHYAKSLCENSNVVSMKLSGGDMKETTIYHIGQRG